MKAPKQDRWPYLVLYLVVGLAGMTLGILALLSLGAWLSRQGV